MIYIRFNSLSCIATKICLAIMARIDYKIMEEDNKLDNNRNIKANYNCYQLFLLRNNSWKIWIIKTSILKMTILNEANCIMDSNSKYTSQILTLIALLQIMSSTNYYNNKVSPPVPRPKERKSVNRIYISMYNNTCSSHK